MHALDVPGQGHEVPLALRLVQPAHAHLTPAHDVLDDAEHGLDGLLAQFVQRPACLCAQAMGHAGDRLRSARRVDLGLGLRDGTQTVLAAGNLGGHIHAIGRAGSIILLRPRQQVLDFLAQLRLDLVGMPPRQRLVLARVGSDLGAVQRNVAELEQLHLARQHQHLHEQRLDLLQKAPPERGQRIVVRMRIGRHKAERHRVVGRALDLAARMHPVGIPVDQQSQQHRRVMRGRAPARVLLDQIIQIKPINHFHHKAREVITGQPLVHRRRQKVGRVSINTNEATHREELLNGLSPLSRIHPSGVSLESPTASYPR